MKTVMTVDDSASLRQMVSFVLRGGGYEVIEATDGLDALTTTGVRTDGRLFLIGGGSRSPAFQAVVAALSGRPVIVPAADEFVTAGACLQAALTLSVSASQSGFDPSAAVAQTASEWNLGTGTTIEGGSGIDIEAVRRAYAQVRA